MGAAAPNPRTCRVLTHRDGLLILSLSPQGARREAPLGVLPPEFRQTGSATSHPRPPGSPQSASLFPGKGIFGPEKSGSGKPNRMSFPQRRTLMKSVRRGGLVGLEPLSLKSGCSFESDQLPG